MHVSTRKTQGLVGAGELRQDGSHLRFKHECVNMRFWTNDKSNLIIFCRLAVRQEPNVGLMCLTVRSSDTTRAVGSMFNSGAMVMGSCLHKPE